MNINEIDQMINELKQCDTTYSNIKDLAALYIVKENLNAKQSSTEKELSDILPAYQSYIDSKRKYQFKQVDITLVENKLKMLCIEVFEFIDTLYKNTDAKEERTQLKRCILKLSEIFSKNT